MSARSVLARHGIASKAPAGDQSDADALPQGSPMAARESADVAVMRRRLRALASASSVASRIVDALTVADLEACIGEEDGPLCAYLAALARAACMAAGRVPEGWTHAAWCRSCGPVYVSPGHPATADRCPWCPFTRQGLGFIRPLVPHGWTRAGFCEACGPVYLPADHAATGEPCPWCRGSPVVQMFKRPPVRCGDCARFAPSPFNPEAGMGVCTVGKAGPRSPLPFPSSQRQCRFWLHQTPVEAFGGAEDGREHGRATGSVLGSFLELPPAGNSDPAGGVVNTLEFDLTRERTE